MGKNQFYMSWENIEKFSLIRLSSKISDHIKSEND